MGKYYAASYAAITDEMDAAISQAAAEVGASAEDVQRFFLDGQFWEATTPGGLADEIAACWREAVRDREAERD